jgi:hypothetical protein
VNITFQHLAPYETKESPQGRRGITKGKQGFTKG